MVLALVIYAPNFVWNWQNGFVSYHHTEANAALGGPLFHPANFFAFFGSQFGVFGPVLFAALLVAPAWAAAPGPRRAKRCWHSSRCPLWR